MNYLPNTSLQEQQLNAFSQKNLKHNFDKIKSKLTRLPLLICLFSFTLFFSHNSQAQTYTGTETFDNGGTTYSFDFSIVCSGDGTSALVTVTYATPPGTPPGLVPQLHLGGGVFVGMSGSNPFTYNITGLTACDFNLQFWMAYEGGLHSSDFINPMTLPIVLANFSVTKRGESTAMLEWKTLTEINSDYFGIERSFDGIRWENISEINAAGDSYTDLSYSYLDSDLLLSPYRTIVYYRLKLIDLDGTFEYSNISSIKFDNKNNSLISIYPNPTTERINVDLTDINMQAGNVQLSLYNNSGRAIMMVEVNGNGIESLDMTTLPSATYSIIVRQGTETISQSRVIKVN